MVNPGSFKGLRKQFLSQQQGLFAEAHANNHVSDTVADIQRRYFKRFPVSLPHDEEPTPEWLAQVDDNAPDDEIAAPDSSILTPEEYTATLDDYNRLAKLIQYRKDQIRRRLVYEYQKEQKKIAGTPFNTTNADPTDPMTVLMARLTGVSVKKPRFRTGYNVWGPQHRFFVDPIFEERVKDQGLDSKHYAAVQSQLYKEFFDELDDDEKKEWEDRAKSEHQAAVEEYEFKLRGTPSTKPKDRQRVIHSLPNFAQPLLDIIAAHTGWKGTLIAGGPEPANNGRLNMISMHSGETKGTIKMNFGKSERRAYSQYIIPIFAIEECRACALECDAGSLAKILASEKDKFTLDSMENYDSVKIKGLDKARSVSAGSNSSANTFSQEGTAQPTPARKVSQNIRTYVIPHNIGPPTRAKRLAKALAAADTSATGVNLDRTSNVDTDSHSDTPINVIVDNNVACSTQQFPADIQTLVDGDQSRPERNCASFTPLPATMTRPLLDGDHTPPASVPISRASSPSSTSLAPVSKVMDPSTARSTSPCNTHNHIDVHAVLEKPRSESDAVDEIIELQPTSLPIAHRNMRQNGASESGSENIPSPLVRRRSIDVVGGADEERTKKKLKLVKSNSSQRCDDLFDVTTASHPLSAPAHWPKWFSEAIKAFKSVSLSVSWIKLLAKWIAFQEQAQFQENGKLGTTSRPTCISEWIKYARDPDFNANIVNLSAFCQQFTQWWTSLQPSWRLSDNSSVLRRIDGDFDVLKKHGKNGLYSVMAALWFWGKAAKGQDCEGGEAEWHAAIDDVAWAIEAMTS